MAQNETYMRALVQQHGTGIASRADASGNHQISSGMIDQYSQAGLTIPANLQPALKELNDLTQREVALQHSTPEARVALGGSGYDPLATRNRVSELEKYLYEQSADVRNMVPAIELRRKQEELRAIEMSNDLTQQTLGANIDATIAGFNLQRAQDVNALDTEQSAALARSLGQKVDEAGLSVNELYDVLTSDDPMLMRQTFGTTDKKIAHTILNERMIAQDTALQNRISMSANAVSAAALDLAGDPNVSDEDLMKIQAGEIPMPDGQTVYSVSKAVGERQAMLEAQTKYNAAVAQGVVQGAQLEQLVLGSMTATQLSGLLSEQIAQGTMGGPHDSKAIAASMNRAIITGNAADVADVVNAAMQNAGSDGYIQVPTPDGGIARVSVQGLMQAVLAKTSEARDKVSTEMMNNNRVQGYMKELEMTEKDMVQQAAFAGVPLTPGTMAQVQAARTQAQKLMESAMTEPDPERAAQMQAAAGDIMQRARDVVAAEAGSRMSPELAESARKGYFVSPSAHKSALVGAVGFGEAGPRANDPIGQSVFALLKSKDISPRQFQEWAASGDSDLSGLGVTPQDIFTILEDANLQLLSSVALEEMTSNPKYREIFRPGPDGDTNPVMKNMQTSLEGLLDGSIMREAGITSKEVLSRTMSIVRMADEMLAMQDEQAAMAGQGGGSYRRGELLQAIQDQFNNSDAVRNYLQAGNLSKESAALYGLIVNTYMPEIPVTGEQSMPISQLGETVSNLTMRRLANVLAGEQLTSLAPIRGAMFRNSFQLSPWSEQGSFMSAEGRAQQKENDFYRQMAIASVTMDKLANPDAFRSNFWVLPDSARRFVPSAGMSTSTGGMGVPRGSFWWSLPLANDGEVRSKLTQMGLDPARILDGAE